MGMKLEFTCKFPFGRYAWLSMSKPDFNDFPWIAPWQAISIRGKEAYEAELKIELSRKHPLYGIRVTAIGRTTNNDDVLFVLHGHPSPLAVVHLTFSRKLEADHQWPAVEFYAGIDDFIMDRMIVDVAGFETFRSDQAA
jgi:hypothetical protein